MKIAIPYLEGNVNPHFGSSREFVVFEANNGKIIGKKVVSNEMMHNHGGLANMLKAEGVDVVITGGIGLPMVNALQQTGLDVVTGVSGNAEQVAGEFLNGRLVSRPISCSCSGHHGHGHGPGR